MYTSGYSINMFLWILWWMFVSVVITTNSASSFISNLLQETYYSCNRAKKEEKMRKRNMPRVRNTTNHKWQVMAMNKKQTGQIKHNKLNKNKFKFINNINYRPLVFFLLLLLILGWSNPCVAHSYQYYWAEQSTQTNPMCHFYLILV